VADRLRRVQATRRTGPRRDGVPVGTEYHWYILAHQNVAKQTANDYTTPLTGLKFKIAHTRAGSEKEVERDLAM
jgi:hypothetical protein